MHPYAYLAIAIAAEVVATIFLKSTEGFSKLWPSLMVIVGYAVSFGSLSLSLKAGMSLSMGYAIWSGVGTAAVAVAGILFYRERIGMSGFIGIALIIAGVVLLHLGPQGTEGGVSQAAQHGRVAEG